MFDQGQGFLDATKILYGVLSVQTPQIAFPMSTCMAFSTELMMKVLRSVEAADGPLKTHDLRALWRDLSSESRDWISAKWSNVNGLQSLRDNPNYDAIVPNTLEEALDQAAMAFVDWRYPPAGQRISIHLGPLPQLVSERILVLKPDWLGLEIKLNDLGPIA